MEPLERLLEPLGVRRCDEQQARSPKNSEKNITASMSPSAAARTGFAGTRSVSSSMPLFGACALASTAERSAAPAVMRARASGDMPSPVAAC